MLDRECSRSQKYLQLTHDKLVQAELSLRYWREHQTLHVWAPILLFTNRSDYRSLELALIQEWQPRLNYPFICQFHHPKKGLLKRPAMNTNVLFGLATLWRRARHRFTRQVVLASDRSPNRLQLWHVVQISDPTPKPASRRPSFFALTKVGSHCAIPFVSTSSSIVMARLSFVSKRLTETDTFERKRWRPTSSHHRHLRDSPGESINEHMGTLSTIGELLEKMVSATHTRSCLSRL